MGKSKFVETLINLNNICAEIRYVSSILMIHDEDTLPHNCNSREFDTFSLSKRDLGKI